LEEKGILEETLEGFGESDCQTGFALVRGIRLELPEDLRDFEKVGRILLLRLLYRRV